MVRDVYLTNDIDVGTIALARAITACLADEVPEIQTLGRTLQQWRPEILNHHRTGASNGPTEGMNLCIKKVKRAEHGFHRFDHYRLRVLLHTGGCPWDQLTNRPRPIRTRGSPPKLGQPLCWQNGRFVPSIAVARVPCWLFTDDVTEHVWIEGFSASGFDGSIQGYKESGIRNLEYLAQFHDVLQSDVTKPTLHLSDVGPVKSCQFRQGLLRQPAFKPGGSEIVAEALENWVGFRHPAIRPRPGAYV